MSGVILCINSSTIIVDITLTRASLTSNRGFHVDCSTPFPKDLLVDSGVGTRDGRSWWQLAGYFIGPEWLAAFSCWNIKRNGVYKLTIVVLARVSLHTYMLHNLFVEWE